MRIRGNSYQVMVFAGIDPVTGERSYLSESTRDPRQVEEIRTRLLAQVDRQRNAETRATLAYAIDEWLTVHEAKDEILTPGFVANRAGPSLPLQCPS